MLKPVPQLTEQVNVRIVHVTKTKCVLGWAIISLCGVRF